MPTKFRKQVRKRKGQRTHGYGRVGAHRKSGQRGGKGLTTGKFKHKWTYYTKQKSLGFPDPRWKIGKKGFKRPPGIVRTTKVNPINVRDLDTRLDQFVQGGKAEKKGKTYTIDLADLNVQKLLGSGRISKKVKVTVRTASPRAVEKIEAAGGSVELTAESD